MAWHLQYLICASKGWGDRFIDRQRNIRLRYEPSLNCCAWFCRSKEEFDHLQKKVFAQKALADRMPLWSDIRLIDAETGAVRSLQLAEGEKMEIAISAENPLLAPSNTPKISAGQQAAASRENEAGSSAQPPAESHNAGSGPPPPPESRTSRAALRAGEKPVAGGGAAKGRKRPSRKAA